MINPYQQSYTPQLSGTTPTQLALLPKDAEPLVVESAPDTTASNHQAESKGYVRIGASAFNGPLAPVQYAIDFGKSIGATYIIVSHQYTGTKIINSLETVPVSTSVTTSDTYRQNGKPAESAKRTTTTTQDTLVPVTTEQRRYDMAAIYYAKPLAPSKFGIGYQGLTPELRKKLQRNTGVIVRIVVENYPAFKSNILEGDIIVAVNNTEVASTESAGQVFNNAQAINGIYQFHIIRNGKTMVIPVREE